MTPALRIGFVLAACALVEPSVGAERAAETSKYVTEKITVTGAVEHELMLSVDELRKFASQVVALAQTGSNAGRLVKLKGVLLRDIIERAACAQPQRHQEDGRPCHCQRRLHGRIFVE